MLCVYIVFFIIRLYKLVSILMFLEIEIIFCIFVSFHIFSCLILIIDVVLIRKRLLLIDLDITVLISMFKSKMYIWYDSMLYTHICL